MVVVSVVTATGHKMAQRIIPEADGHIFFPFDLPVITSRIVKIVDPKVIILIETELWPNFLRLSWRRKIPVMMMNGRISDRSMRRYSPDPPVHHEDAAADPPVLHAVFL